jgi:hypothetical protein
MLELRVQEIVADLEKELAPLQRQLEQSLEIHSYAIVLTRGAAFSPFALCQGRQ